MSDIDARSPRYESVGDEVAKKTGLPVIRTMTGRRSTTFCIGGEYSFFLEPNTELELIEVRTLLDTLSQPSRVLGAGSNLLVADAGITDWVIRLGRGFRTFEKIGPATFWVGGSMPLMSLARDLSEAGFSGLEFAGGIPASIGGATRMNAGAHGSEMSSIIRRVRFLSPHAGMQEVTTESLTFSYRKSSFEIGSIITGIAIELTPSDPLRVKTARANYLAERKKRQPLSSPSAGSVFKNPAQSTSSAGALIEEAGLKGLTNGGAEISALHGNWIVNPSKYASAANVQSLIAHCQQTVSDAAGIFLEPEVVTWR